MKSSHRLRSFADRRAAWRGQTQDPPWHGSSDRNRWAAGTARAGFGPSWRLADFPAPGRFGRRARWQAGTTIPKGAPIFLVYASANRDPERFENPDELDLERPDNQHLGFSQGIHYCFGAPLARLEVQIAVGEFVRRVQNPRLVADPPPYRHNQIFRGPRHLLVDIDGIRD